MNTPQKCQRCKESPSTGIRCAMCRRTLCRICRTLEALNGKCRERAATRKWSRRVMALLKTQKMEGAKAANEQRNHFRKKDRLPAVVGT